MPTTCCAYRTTTAIVRTLIGGVPTQPFSMATLPPLGNPNPKLADALKQLSAAKYGEPRARSREPKFSSAWQPRQSRQAGFGAPAPGWPGPGRQPASAGRVASAGPEPGNRQHFLDEWHPPSGRLAPRPAPSSPALSRTSCTPRRQPAALAASAPLAGHRSRAGASSGQRQPAVTADHVRAAKAMQPLPNGVTRPVCQSDADTIDASAQLSSADEAGDQTSSP